MHSFRLGFTVLLAALLAPSLSVLAQDDDDPMPTALVADLQIVMPDGRMRALPIVEESLRVTIDGQHATTRLRQVFHNPEPQAVEGSYDLVAGPGARVSGFAYWNGETKIVGEVFERAVAEQVYTRVTTRRRDPGLLVQRGEGSFGFRVFPIQPDEDKRVEVDYAHWLPRRGRALEYRAPVSDARASIELTIRSAQAIDNLRSSTHALRVERVNGGVRVRARAEGRPRELVLQYDVGGAEFQPALAVHRDRDQDGYFVLSLAAPEQRDADAMPKDVTLVVDRSGSMAGAPLEQARRAVADIIERLDPRDGVNVIAFDDDVDPLFARPHEATDDIRREAAAFVSGISSGGGTNVAYALKSALERQQDAANRPRVVLLITDGRSDPAAALNAAQRDRRDVRVFTVGVGGEVDRPLLARLAALKRGRFTFIASESALESAMHDVYSQIAQPVMVDISLEVEGAALQRVYPRTLPDLFARDELRISGRVRGERGVRFTLVGTQNGRRVRREISADLSAPAPRPWVGRLWAEARVDDLLEELALGGEAQELTDEVVDLSLAYNFVTPYTAFLAIPESEVTADVAGDLSRARERKADVLERLADAQALSLATPAAGGSDQMDTLVEPLSGSARADVVETEASIDSRLAERAGCASCAVGAPRMPRPLAWLALAIGAALFVRRRRARAARWV